MSVIRFEIGTLVVEGHGGKSIDREDFGERIRSSLQDLCMERGIPRSMTSKTSVVSIDDGPRAVGSSYESARRVALGVYRALAPEKL